MALTVIDCYKFGGWYVHQDASGTGVIVKNKTYDVDYHLTETDARHLVSAIIGVIENKK